MGKYALISLAWIKIAKTQCHGLLNRVAARPCAKVPRGLALYLQAWIIKWAHEIPPVSPAQPGNPKHVNMLVIFGMMTSLLTWWDSTFSTASHTSLPRGIPASVLSSWLEMVGLMGKALLTFTALLHPAQTKIVWRVGTLYNQACRESAKRIPTRALRLQHKEKCVAPQEGHCNFILPPSKQGTEKKWWRSHRWSFGLLGRAWLHACFLRADTEDTAKPSGSEYYFIMASWEVE